MSKIVGWDAFLEEMESGFAWTSEVCSPQDAYDELAEFYRTQEEMFGEVKLSLGLIYDPNVAADINNNPVRKAELDGYAVRMQVECLGRSINL